MEDIEMNENDRESISGFWLIEMSILSKVLSLLACPNCYNTSPLKLTDVADKKYQVSVSNGQPKQHQPAQIQGRTTNRCKESNLSNL